MQQWHEEEQQSLLQLQEAAEARCAECAAQKARREAEAKAKKEAERQRVAEEEEDKGVPPATLGQGARGRGRPIGGG